MAFANSWRDCHLACTSFDILFSFGDQNGTLCGSINNKDRVFSLPIMPSRKTVYAVWALDCSLISTNLLNNRPCVVSKEFASIHLGSLGLRFFQTYGNRCSCSTALWGKILHPLIFPLMTACMRTLSGRYNHNH